MTKEDDWILMLENYPVFFEMSKGGLFISVLKDISAEARSYNELRKLFPHVERNDFSLILETLVKLKLVSQKRISSNIYYALTQDGEKLLDAYKKAKTFYST